MFSKHFLLLLTTGLERLKRMDKLKLHVSIRVRSVLVHTHAYIHWLCFQSAFLQPPVSFVSSLLFL